MDNTLKITHSHNSNSPHSITPHLSKFLRRLSLEKVLQGLQDPRKHRKKKFDFMYVLQIVFHGLLGGSFTLRALESLSDSYGMRISDTTLYDITGNIDAIPLKRALAVQVKDWNRNHVFDQEFPVKVVAIDGKSLSVSLNPVGEYSQKRTLKNGEVRYFNRALRAVLVSGENKVFLGQHMIPGATNETTQLLPFVDELLSFYEDTNLLGVLTVDAGFASLHNAKGLQERGVRYVMQIKQNQPTLYEKILRATEDPFRTDDAQNIVEPTKRCRIFQSLRKATIYAKEWGMHVPVWRLEQTTEMQDINGEWKKKEKKTRLFLTNLDDKIFDNLQIIQIIRMHWGIESVPQHTKIEYWSIILFLWRSSLKDGGRSTEVCYRKPASNHFMRLLLRAVVVSNEVKA